MKRDDVWILVEHKDRELKQVRRIASILQQEHGCSVRILSLFFHVYKMLFLPKPRLVVLPFGMSEDIWPMNLLRFILPRTTRYMHLSWEQYLFASNKAFKRPRDRFMRENVHYLAWEDEFKIWLIAEGVPADHVYVCGNPNIEMMQVMAEDIGAVRSRLAQYYDFDVYRKTAYFPLNYAWSFLNDKAIEVRIANGYDERDAWAYREYSRKCRDAFIPFIISVARKAPDVGIIIRPHPGVHVSQYEELFVRAIGEVPQNIHLINEESAHEWVLCADIVGSSLSTVCYDALQFGKQAFFYTPYPHPSFLQAKFLEGPPSIASGDEFFMLLEASSDVETCIVGKRHSEAVAKAIVNVLEKGHAPHFVHKLTLKGFCYMCYFVARLSVAALLSPYVERFKHLRQERF